MSWLGRALARRSNGQAGRRCLACRSDGPTFPRVCAPCLATLRRMFPEHAALAVRPERAPAVDRRDRRAMDRHAERTRRALAESRRTLDVLTRSDRPREVETADVIQAWLAWDEADAARDRLELHDDLAVLYPDATDGQLEVLAEAFRVRPSRGFKP